MSVTVLLALLFSTLAQAPSSDSIARQLDSRDAQTLAWGAYNAGAYHRVDLVPRLQQILETPPPIGPFEERAFLDVVMDALVQLKATVPASVLVPYLEKRPVHTLVLLASARDRDGVLVELLPRLSGIEWFAAANILFEDRSPGLVEHLARTAKLKLTVHVADSDTVSFGGSDGVSVGIGCGVGQDPPGYPPHAEYRFGFAAHPGVIVLASGPRPVYYSRTVTASRQYPVSQADVGGPTDEDRVDYLRAMSPDTGGIPFRAHSVETVAWSTAGAFSQRVQELRTGIELRFRHLVERARQSRGIGADLVVQPPIDLTIVDHRSNQSVPLPTIGR